MARATLAVWTFDSADAADQAVGAVVRLADEGDVALHDAATVAWHPGAAKPTTRLLTSSPRAGALGGTFWGMLLGLIFFVPLLGAALGAATGALSGTLTDVGIDDGFINRIRDQVTPGTSALFVLSSEAVVDQLRDAFTDHEPSGLIFTNLTSEQESALREVFDQD